MSNTTHIAYHNDYDTSNYGLRGRAVPLSTRERVGFRPDGDGWEEVWIERDEIYARYKAKIRQRLGRKQMAAKRVIPVNKITLDPFRKGVQPVQVVEAILAGKSDQQIEIARIQARIQELLGVGKESK